MEVTIMDNLVDGKYSIKDLVDLDRLRRILEQFTVATDFTTGFLDHPDMNILVATGWRDICVKYHRSCPLAEERCLRSNRHLLDQLVSPGQVIIESCDNGLVDCAMPIIVKGKHIASLATGQLLLGEPDLDRFRRQAEEFGIDQAEYLKALSEVPVVSEEKLKRVTEFLGEMAMIISELGYTNLLIKEEALLLETEVAERRRVEEGLRLSEEKYRFLTERVGDIVWTMDLDYRTTYVSPSIETILGFTPEERMEQTLEEMVAQGSIGEVVGTFIRELKRKVETEADRDRSVTQEVEYICKDGSTLWMENTIKVIRDSNGFIEGIYGVSRDISEKRRADREKDILRAQLMQAQKMESVGRLAGGVAHDFNNMLTVILGQTELAMGELSSGDPLRTALEEIRKAGERSAGLTQKLLAFARKQVAIPRQLNLNATMESMLGMLKRLIGEGIELLWLPGEGIWPLKADPGQIDQVLVNLCVNSRDAIDGVGRIEIGTGNIVISEEDCSGHPGLYPGNYVLITVRDSGCGMSEEIIDHIFEPFFTTKSVGQGTGLGLATVYGIVKQNGGYIDAISEPGKGTVFRIYLPRSEEGTAAPGSPAPAEIQRGRSEVVMIVEDEELILELGKTMLQNLGYEVLVAGTPKEALQLASSHEDRIDLLVSDMIMPEMNGIALATRIRKIIPEIGLLFMSGYPANLVARSSFLDLKAGFIQKPFTSGDLAAHVRQALDRC